MSVCVIERFEFIHIQEHQRTIAATAFAGSHGLYQPVVQQTAVGELRQGIVESQRANLLLSLPAHGNVVHHADVVGGLSGIPLHHSDGELLWKHVTVFAPVPDFALPCAGAQDALPHRGIKGRVMAARAEQVRCLADCFLCRVTGDPGEGAVDAQNYVPGIGDYYAVLGFKGGGGDAKLCLSLFALGDVGQHDAHHELLAVFFQAQAIQLGVKTGTVAALECQFTTQFIFVFQHRHEMAMPAVAVLPGNERGEAVVR